jgi:hypothetical protein
VGSASAATPADARGFVDSIGVNTHLFYTDTVYADFAMIKTRLQELGVRHIRDGMDPGRRQWFFDRVNSLGQAGIKSTMINCQFVGDGWEHYTADVKTKVRNSVEAVEGVNEPELQQGGQHDGGEWWNDTRGCNYWTKELLARDAWAGPPLNIPVYGPSATGTAFKKLGNLFEPPHADGGNMHPYPGARPPSGPDYYPFARSMAEIREWNFEGRQVPVVATETGYHDAVNCSGCGHYPISQRGEGIYLPRLFMEYARAGVARTFTYELVDRPDPGRDDPESNFGLFESDWSYKPSATALKNTIGFLDSPSVSNRTTLDYKLSNTGDPDGSGTGGAVKDSLFQKADGSWWLALWQDSSVWDRNARKDISNPSVNVKVTLPRAMNITGYLPTRGTGTYGSGRWSSFSAGVGDDVLLIKLAD